MSEIFDKHSTDWQDYQGKPWGRLFYSISHEYLRPYISHKQSSILDIGGGNGLSAINYALEGHNVTIVDISEEMLSVALQSAQKAGIENKINFHVGNVLELSTLFSNPEFDVILCHNVLAYVDNISTAIKEIFHCLHVNGVISLISMNPYSEVYREALHQLNPKAAMDKLDSSTYTANTFKSPITLYTIDEMVEILQKEDCVIEDRYGIRCINDYIADNEIKEDETFFIELEKLEIVLGKKYPYNLIARFFQVIARKIG